MMAKPLFKVRPIRDLKDMLEQSAGLFGDKPAFHLKDSNDNYYDITYRDFKNDVDALGTAFHSMGLKDGFIAVLGENRYEWCVTYLSTVNGTGIIVPLDKELPPPEIENLLNRSGAIAVIFSGKHEKEMKLVASINSTVKYFIDMDLENDEGGFISYKKLLKQGRQLMEKGDRSFIDSQIDDKKMSILLFTSGTTDLAKGVMLSHKNICSDILSVCSVLYLDNSDSALSILPLHHTYECTCGFLLMLYNGCKISFNEGLKHIAKNLKETAPSIVMLVPLILETMYKKIWDQAGKKKGGKRKLKAAMAISDFLLNATGIDIRRKLFGQIHDSVGGNIRLIISGAAAIDPDVLKGFRSFGITVLQGYGLTECSPIVTVNHMKNYNNKSIGLALPGVEVRIENPGSDGIGELAVKGDNVMLGYFNNTLATEKVMKNGWLMTGDLGKLDKDHFFYITGRKKNVIVTKNGKNIYPEEVEEYLNKSPYILESLVWGKVDEASEETFVNAQIVPALDYIKEKLGKEEISTEEIFKVIDAEVKIANRNMPLYKRIRQFTVREEEFAKTTTKKIKRYAEKIS